MEAELSIQQVVRQMGLSIDTLRYYERIGLIEPVRRATSGHRRYRQADLDWIGLIIRLRETGMPLVQIRHFAQLRSLGSQTTRERRSILERHQHSLEQQMQQLEQHMEALSEEIECYKEREVFSADSPASSNNATKKDE